MNRFTTLLLLPILLLASYCQAQTSAVVVVMPDGKTMMVLVVLPSGPQVITNVIVHRLDTPPVPPPPTVLATSAMILLETQDQDATLAILRVGISTDPWLNTRLAVLDKDAKNQDNQPVKRVQDALKFLGNKPLPQIVGFSSVGEPVTAEPLPKTVAGVTETMKRWGIK
jgi:hypothetical protein